MDAWAIASLQQFDDAFYLITTFDHQLAMDNTQPIWHYILMTINIITLQPNTFMGNCEGNQILEETHVPLLGRLGPVVNLKVINYVWQRDYQGLFDYDSRQIRKQVYHARQSGILLASREQKVVEQISKQQYTQSMLKRACFEMVRKDNYFKVLPIYIDNEQFTVQKLLWLIIKTVPQHKYALKEKDVLKFGKQKIKVREIVHLDSSSPVDHSPLNIRTHKKIYNDISLRLNPEQEHDRLHPKEEIINELQSVATQNEASCRICLEPGQHNNPLICACKCTGSVKYIHLNCLRTWLGKQLKLTHNKFCITIKWTPLACEMCKTHYKYRIYLDNKKFYTVEIPKPEKPYIVLEVIKKSAEYSKIFHFITFGQTSRLSIGRKKDIDIKISDDISISRHHANISYDLPSRKFFIQDNKSKFGSLVLVKKNLLINPFQKGIGFQMGAEIFMFEAVRGEGAIDNYQDHEQFLNVRQGDEEGRDEQSDENNEQDQQFEEEEEQDGVQANPNFSHINNNSNSLVQNHSQAQPINQPQPIQQIQNQPPQNASMNLNSQVGHAVSIVELDQ